LWIEHTEMDDVTALTDKIRAFVGKQEQTPVSIDRDLPY
jgi:hypothetical protein